VILDINGDGILLTKYTDGVEFNFDGAGRNELVAWTEASSDDAWLALDRNNNGRIDSSLELFGDLTQQPTSNEPNGFRALAEYDKHSNGGNRDDKISSQDTIFSSLRLWQDVNHNGISEPSELHTLPSLGVIKMDLDYRESRRTDEHGNHFRYRAKVRDAQGADVGRWAWDVFLQMRST